jgi:hypothetical protein
VTEELSFSRAMIIVVGYFEKLEVSINASVAEHDFKLLDGQ